MIELAHATIRYYGCTLCQAYHEEGQPLYEDHKLFQSKHGIEERSDPTKFVPRGDSAQFVGRLP